MPMLFRGRAAVKRLTTEAALMTKAYFAGRLRGHEKEAIARIDEKTRAIVMLTGQTYTAVSQKIHKEKKRMDKRAGRNPSGNLDPTATQAVEKIDSETAKLREIIRTLDFIIALGGYEKAERIVLVDKKTGRVWK